MDSKALKEKRKLMDSQRIEDMSNIFPNKTGLNRIIWVSAKVEKHKPRIKIFLDDNHTISFSIEDNPQILVGDINKLSSREINDIKNWIVINKDALLDYWNLKIDSVDLGGRLQKI